MYNDGEGSSGIDGLIMMDGPCFFNGGSMSEEKLCISNELVRGEGCSFIKTNEMTGISDDMRYCDDGKLFFNIDESCAWINGDGVDMCIGERTAEKCSFYKRMDKCSVTRDGGKCSWIEINNIGECINEKTASRCDFYVRFDDCKETIDNSECVWINGNGLESCILEKTANECNYYRNMKDCTKTNNNVICSWIKKDNNYSCINEKSSELCEYYMTKDGCTMTGSGSVCSWNSISGKCSSGSKSCSDFTSYSGCNAVNEQCFWNGKLYSSDGVCVALEKEYMCINLSKTVCNNYGNIEGLTIVDEPCFFNGVDEKELSCRSVESVMKRSCDVIKTNERVDVGGGPRYCDNALLIFGMNGDDGMGCVWDETNSCKSLLEDEILILESCDEYKSVEECNYHTRKDGVECFWNGDGMNDEDMCVSVEEIENCSVICTNDISGINAHYCDGKAMDSGSTSEMCKWEESGEETNKNCNCDGVTIEENCGLMKATSGSDCKKLKSLKGGCFFNGNSNESVGTEIKCTDISDVTECEFLRDDVLCTYAKKSIYTNLETNSSSGLMTFLCIWDVETRVCKSKEIGKVQKEKNNNQATVIVVIIIIVVVFILAVATVIVIIVLFMMKKVKKQKNNEQECSIINENTESSKEIESNSYKSCMFHYYIYIYLFINLFINLFILFIY
jgi:NADH:ubiquinone oxidoreductase subunit 3 (subunit A)